MADSDAGDRSLSATRPLADLVGETRIEPARVRGSEPAAGFAPVGPSAERDFFTERLAFFAKIATLASAGFLTMRLVIDVFVRQVGLQGFHYPHFAGTVVLFLVWVLAGSRAFSDKGLRRLDAAGTIAPRSGTSGWS